MDPEQPHSLKAAVWRPSESSCRSSVVVYLQSEVSGNMNHLLRSVITESESEPTHINIVAPARRLVRVRPGVDIKRVLPRGARAHVERGGVGPRHVRVRPGDGVAGECERAVRVIGGLERGREGPLGLVGGVLDVEVQGAGGGPRPGITDELPWAGPVGSCGCRETRRRGSSTSPTGGSSASLCRYRSRLCSWPRWRGSLLTSRFSLSS